MPESALTASLVENLETLRLDYFITGSVATAIYSEFRFTHDVDVVVTLQPKSVADFCRLFAESKFGVDEYSVRQAMSTDDINMTYLPTGEKADVMLPVDSDFNESRFADDDGSKWCRTATAGSPAPSMSS